MTQGGGKRRKPFVLPDFTQPVLSVTSVPPPVADKGCRLEANSLYIRYWEKGNISSDPVTSPLTVNYAFPSDMQTWSTQGTLPSGVTQAWSSADGKTSTGCLQIGSNGSGVGGSVSYFRLITSWTSLGVPAGKSVTNISFSLWDRIGSTGTSSSFTLGPYALYDSANSTLISTMISGRSVGPGTTSWAQQNSGSISIPSLYQPAATNVVFRVGATTNASDSTMTARFDDISIVITFV